MSRGPIGAVVALQETVGAVHHRTGGGGWGALPQAHHAGIVILFNCIVRR